MTITGTGRPTRLESRQKSVVMQRRASGFVARRQSIPEYLDPHQVESLLKRAPNIDCELLMRLQWRAGPRISEALNLEVADLHLDVEPALLRVRQGKGGKDRMVPVHGELHAALSNHIRYARKKSGRLVAAHRSTAWRWYEKALEVMKKEEEIPDEREIGTHTLRHSAARHWLMNGVPINLVSVWLGHASLQTTLVYLKIIADPGNWMERVP